MLTGTYEKGLGKLEMRGKDRTIEKPIYGISCTRNFSTVPTANLSPSAL